MDANKTVTATFTEEPLDGVNTVSEGSVTLDPAGGSYDADKVLGLTPVSDGGCAYNDWSGYFSGYLNPATILINKDKTITAIFNEDGDVEGISDA